MLHQGTATLSTFAPDHSSALTAICSSSPVSTTAAFDFGSNGGAVGGSSSTSCTSGSVSSGNNSNSNSNSNSSSSSNSNNGGNNGSGRVFDAMLVNAPPHLHHQFPMASSALSLQLHSPTQTQSSQSLTHQQQQQQYQLQQQHQHQLQQLQQQHHQQQQQLMSPRSAINSQTSASASVSSSSSPMTPTMLAHGHPSLLQPMNISAAGPSSSLLSMASSSSSSSLTSSFSPSTPSISSSPMSTPSSAISAASSLSLSSGSSLSSSPSSSASSPSATPMRAACLSPRTNLTGPSQSMSAVNLMGMYSSQPPPPLPVSNSTSSLHSPRHAQTHSSESFQFGFNDASRMGSLSNLPQDIGGMRMHSPRNASPFMPSTASVRVSRTQSDEMDVEQSSANAIVASNTSNSIATASASTTSLSSSSSVSSSSSSLSSPSSHCDGMDTSGAIIPSNNGDEDSFVDISEYLTMSQVQAAARLGLAPSTLSKRWKEATNGRGWPWRKVRKIDKELSLLVHNVRDGRLPPDVETRLSLLVSERESELRPVYIRLRKSDERA